MLINKTKYPKSPDGTNLMSRVKINIRPRLRRRLALFEWDGDIAISDTAELLEGDPYTKHPRGRETLCFLFVSVSSCSTGDTHGSQKGILIRVFLQGPARGDMKPLQTLLFLQFTTAGLVCCSPITRLQIHASSKTVGRNKYEEKDSETSRTPRFVLVCPQILI